MIKNSNYLKHILDSYKYKREEIKARLKEFEKVGEEGDERIFTELCFCILTPQSKAKVCDSAVQNLVKTNMLFEGTAEEIRLYLAGVRFPNNKARYISEARKLFTARGGLKIKDEMGSFDDDRELRRWLVSKIRGLGYKEASHFLRNIGRGADLAILDRHILKNLTLLGVIDEEKAVSNKAYLEIESRMLQFSKEVNISLAELDFLLWSEETGEIFK
ncbi:MAG: N-glycosylase/DNA lyase [Candidatus Hydrothermarchaeales archaeon]